MIKRYKQKNKRGMALSQVVLILLGTVAFAYILGSEIGFVSAATTGEFSFGGTTYTLTDRTSGCRLYTGTETQCYAYSYDAWYPDTDKDGDVDDGTSSVSGLANAVYGFLVPSGYTYTGSDYTKGAIKFKVWKNAAGSYVLTWGQYLTEKVDGVWKNHQGGGMQPWTFSGEIDTYLATLAPDVGTRCVEDLGGDACDVGAGETCVGGTYAASNTALCCTISCTPGQQDAGDDDSNDNNNNDGTEVLTECNTDGECGAGRHCDIDEHICKSDTQAPPVTETPKTDVLGMFNVGLQYLSAAKTAIEIARDPLAWLGLTSPAAPAAGGEVVAGAAEEVVKETATPFLTKVVDKFLNPAGKFLNSALGFAAVTGIAALTQFLITGLSTGDWARAGEAALRVGLAAAAGWGAGTGLAAIISLAAGPAGWIAAGLGVAFALLSQFLIRHEAREITFTCSPWQTPAGGQNCELCNNGNFPCTEYQCASLGAACELVNRDTDNQACSWNNSRDVSPPEVTPRLASLKEGYRYEPLEEALGPGRWIKFGTEECLPAFEVFTFGVELDKRGYCKIDNKRTEDFSQMTHDMGAIDDYTINHTQTMTFPGIANLQQAGIEIPDDGEFAFYVRCMSVNGESNREEFMFKFCIEPGPDESAPEIRGFNWVNSSPIAHFGEDEAREVGVQVYTDEPANCKWDHEDKSFESMVNPLTCNSNLLNFNAQLSYSCVGTLSGLENGVENKFYFRCNDTFGNTNTASTLLTLRGTQQLAINSAGPVNGTLIKGSSDSIKITLTATTSAGADNGVSTCYYSPTGASNSFTKFSDTDSYQHSVNIWLEDRDYNYVIRCIDAGGNSDEEAINFIVETDTTNPVVVRASHETTNLNIKTGEDARCVYDVVDCNYPFEEGISMTTSDGVTHSASWVSGRTYYIKCKDSFNNGPARNSCSENGILSTSQF